MLEAITHCYIPWHRFVCTLLLPIIAHLDLCTVFSKVSSSVSLVIVRQACSVKTVHAGLHKCVLPCMPDIKFSSR